jgi:hypothetical protein
VLEGCRTKESSEPVKCTKLELLGPLTGRAAHYPDKLAPARHGPFGLRLTWLERELQALKAVMVPPPVNDSRLRHHGVPAHLGTDILGMRHPLCNGSTGFLHAPRASRASPSGESMRSETILLAEDEAAVRSVAARTLTGPTRRWRDGASCSIRPN